MHRTYLQFFECLVLDWKTVAVPPGNIAFRWSDSSLNTLEKENALDSLAQ